MSLSVSKHQQLSVNVSYLVTSAWVCHKASVHHQIANSTFFTTSALVLKCSAFLDFRVTFLIVNWSNKYLNFLSGERLSALKLLDDKYLRVNIRLPFRSGNPDSSILSHFQLTRNSFSYTWNNYNYRQCSILWRIGFDHLLVIWKKWRSLVQVTVTS